MTSSPWGKSAHTSLQRTNYHGNLYNTEYFPVMNEALLPLPPA